MNELLTQLMRKVVSEKTRDLNRTLMLAGLIFVGWKQNQLHDEVAALDKKISMHLAHHRPAVQEDAANQTKTNHLAQYP